MLILIKPLTMTADGTSDPFEELAVPTSTICKSKIDLLRKRLPLPYSNER